jgi:hypothetical protein
MATTYQNIPIWPGSSSFFPGMTPFGFYDYDFTFQTDADKMAQFCATRLGYPIMEVELQDIHFYAAFEEAVTTYGNQLYSFKIRDNYLSLEGNSTGSIAQNNTLSRPNLGNIIRIARQYGTEAGTGGDVDWYTGSITLNHNQQVYDLDDWAVSQSITGGIEIKRVFYEAPPAIVRYFDPYAGTGTGVQSLLETFGFGNYSPGINFLLMPVYADLEKIQAIEFNDQIRKSNYSFEIQNNKLRLFPIPTGDVSSLLFQYIKLDERNSGFVSGSEGNGKISNISNVPMNNPVYSQINSVGRQWIFEYTLAIAKEMLGLIRNKYEQIPIPGAEIRLNGPDLITQAKEEKTALIERIRGFLDDTSRKALLERKKDESDFIKQELSNIPFVIYVG